MTARLASATGRRVGTRVVEPTTEATRTLTRLRENKYGFRLAGGPAGWTQRRQVTGARAPRQRAGRQPEGLRICTVRSGSVITRRRLTGRGGRPGLQAHCQWHDAGRARGPRPGALSPAGPGRSRAAEARASPAAARFRFIRAQFHQFHRSSWTR
jgi:hypothetical protein